MDHRSRRTVLVVDDSQEMRELLCESLVDQGYVVDSAANGSEAIDYLMSHPAPNVIVLDLEMPVMNGWDLLAWKAKRPGDVGAVPVITVSGTRSKPQATGVVASLPKPVDLDRLMLCVEAHGDDVARARDGRLAA